MRYDRIPNLFDFAKFVVAIDGVIVGIFQSKTHADGFSAMLLTRYPHAIVEVGELSRP